MQNGPQPKHGGVVIFKGKFSLIYHFTEIYDIEVLEYFHRYGFKITTAYIYAK